MNYFFRGYLTLLEMQTIVFIMLFFTGSLNKQAHKSNNSNLEQID
jgi:hypothetical protein